MVKYENWQGSQCQMALELVDMDCQKIKDYFSGWDPLEKLNFIKELVSKAK